MSAALLRPGEPLTATLRNVLFGIVGLNALVVSMTWPLALLLSEHLKVTGLAQGGLFALQGMGMMLSAELAGRLCDRWGKRSVFIGSLLLFALGWLPVVLHLSYATVAAAQVLTGISTASMTAVSAYFGAHTAAEARSRAFAHMLAVRGIGQVAGPLLVAFGLNLGLGPVCLSLVAIALVPAAGALLLKESRGEPRPAAARGRLGLPHIPATVVLPLLAIVLLYATPGSVSTYLPLHVKDAFGASAQGLSALFSLLGLTMVLAPGVLWLLERWLPERRAAVLSYLAMAVAVVVMTLSNSLPVVVTAYVLWALWWDVSYPYVKAHLSRRAPVQEQAGIQAAEQFATGAVSLVVYPAAGWLYHGAGAVSVFATAAALSLAGVWVLVRSQRQEAAARPDA